MGRDSIRNAGGPRPAPRRTAPRGPDRPRHAAAAALFAVLGGALAGQQAGDAPPASQRLIALLHADRFPQRMDLLHRLRHAIVARRGPAAVAPLLLALEHGSRSAHAALRAWVEQRGGRILHSYWIVPGVAVQLDGRAVADLGRHPAVAVVRSARDLGSAQIRTSTNARNHDSDHVQQVLGELGAGATLALIDSGIDLDVNQTGQPHPAFDQRPPLSGSRIVRAVGIASPGDAEDLHGHGSAVAAIAAAIDWHGSFGLSDDGHAPAARIASYKITSGAALGFDETDVIAAWQQVLADAATFGIRVANHSFDGDPDPTSPTQQALDLAAFFGDILVVTSAGNDGQSLTPGLRSQANASGLAVGAIIADAGQPDAHRVTPFSTYGPLPGDGARWFPDLVACGDSVVSVKIDVPTGITFNQGTSFAAAQVAGIALLVRSAAPAFSALDTKAVILNNVADISAQNPGKSRFHYGLGMPRADLAVAACMQQTMLRGSLSAAQQRLEATFGVQVEADKPYAATLVWPRLDVTTAAWDDLDLAVIDAAGDTIAVSGSPRNLYERVLFQTTVAATYTLKVRGVSLTTAATLPFSLAFGENHGGGRQPGSYDPFGGNTCIGTAPSPAAGVIVPAMAAGGFANARTRVPFSYFTTRLQQAYPGTSIPPGLALHKIAFRRDEQQWDTPTYDLSLQLLLGHTTRDPGSLDPTFAANLDGAMTEVIAPRTVRFFGTQGLPASAGQLDFVLPLGAPFVAATSASRHLLMEVRVFSHTMGNAPFDLLFDAVDDPSVGRVYTQGQPSAPAGIVDNVAICASLMAAGLPPIAPNLQAVGRPQLGASFAIALRNAPAFAPAALVHGLSATTWGSLALPIALAPFGAPACFVLTDSAFHLPVIAGADGQLEVRYPIPPAPALMGEIFFNQFIVLDPAANALGVTLTNAGRALVGG